MSWGTQHGISPDIDRSNTADSSGHSVAAVSVRRPDVSRAAIRDSNWTRPGRHFRSPDGWRLIDADHWTRNIPVAHLCSRPVFCSGLGREENSVVMFGLDEY